MAPLNRFEISGSELIEADEKIALRFEKVGWGQFFKCFDGHNAEVTQTICLKFKRRRCADRGF